MWPLDMDENVVAVEEEGCRPALEVDPSRLSAKWVPAKGSIS